MEWPAFVQVSGHLERAGNNHSLLPMREKVAREAGRMWGRAPLVDLPSWAMDPAPPVKPKRKLARHMRRNPSSAERKLWGVLRDRRLEGLKFRRQMPIGPYVVDFVCLRHRLIVEADGPVHDLRPDNPARDAWLVSQGFRIMRVPNADIFDRSYEVLASILQAVSVPPAGEESETPHPSASG